jgi:hypothetical protein
MEAAFKAHGTDTGTGFAAEQKPVASAMSFD